MRLIHHTTIPKSYNPALVRGTPAWCKAFNKWNEFIKGELMDDRMLKEAQKILDKKAI